MSVKLREKLRKSDPELNLRIKNSNLTGEDKRIILFILRVLPFLLKLIEKGKISIKKLQKIIWGRTESSRNVLNDIEKGKNNSEPSSDKEAQSNHIFPGEEAESPRNEGSNDSEVPSLGSSSFCADLLPMGINLGFNPTSIEAGESSESSESRSSGSNDKDNVISIKGRKKKPRKKSLRGIKAFPDAEKIEALHTEHKSGDRCPKCLVGKLYLMAVFGKIVKFFGAPFLYAKIFLQEKLRCNACGWIVAAQLPPEALGSKAASSAQAMIALLKYGAGTPFYRLSTIQKYLKTPISASSLWLMLDPLSEVALVVWKRLRYHAAQGEVLHNDDTTNKILAFMKPSNDVNKKSKKTVYTSGILAALNGGQKIILFFTGNDHAGTNLENLLSEREAGLEKPIQMSDSSSMNGVKAETHEGSCLTHIRRYFVECYRSHKKYASYFIITLGKIYAIDAQTKNLSKEERLLVHQEKSVPIMNELHKWLLDLLAQKLVEPNCALGEAISHALKHWEKATLFLRVAGAPISNDELEQKFKMVKLSLKNAMFYKTLWGALIGDVFMSIIHTTVLANENPYEYLVAILDNKTVVLKNPDLWMPWNFRTQIEKRSMAA